MDWRPYFPTPWCCRRFQPSAILASWDHQLKCAWGRCWVSKSRTTWRSGVKRTFLEVNQRQHEPKDSQCHASIFRHKIWNIFHSFTLAGTVAGKERTGAGSVPCLGIRFSPLRTTSVIYGYSLNRKIYRCIWTWFQEACTCVTEMIIRTLSLNHMLKEMLQRIRNVFQVTWWRCDNVSGTSCKLLAEDFTTYQERLASYCTCRRFYNISGTCWKSLEENVTTYQKHLASYLKKSPRPQVLP